MRPAPAVVFPTPWDAPETVLPRPEVTSPTVLPTLPSSPPAVFVTPPTVWPRVSPRPPMRLSIRKERLVLCVWCGLIGRRRGKRTVVLVVRHFVRGVW